MNIFSEAIVYSTYPHFVGGNFFDILDIYLPIQLEQPLYQFWYLEYYEEADPERDYYAYILEIQFLLPIPHAWILNFLPPEGY
jgi:hypothetical protein